MGDPGVGRHHLIFISSSHIQQYTLYIPNFWSHSLFPRFCGSTQLRGFSWPGCNISSHFLPTRFKILPLVLTNAVVMSREVWPNPDGRLSAFYLSDFTTTSSKWCISRFPQFVSPGASPIMLDYHLWSD